MVLLRDKVRTPCKSRTPKLSLKVSHRNSKASVITPQRTIRPSSSDENSRIICSESQHKNIDKLFFTCGFFFQRKPPPCPFCSPQMVHDIPIRRTLHGVAPGRSISEKGGPHCAWFLAPLRCWNGLMKFPKFCPM